MKIDRKTIIKDLLSKHVKVCSELPQISFEAWADDDSDISALADPVILPAAGQHRVNKTGTVMEILQNILLGKG